MSEEQTPSVAYVALRARCPRCGIGSLYSSFFKIADSCPNCGVSFKEHEQGDGPAFFCICIIGSFTAIFATIVEVMFEPPFWLHAAIWIPFVIGSSLLGIRAMKAALIGFQYKFRQEDFKE